MATRNEGRSAEEMERTLYVANLHEKVTDEVLYELMIQAGPVENVNRPKERPFAFVVFEHEESVPFAIALFKYVKLFNRPLDIRPRDGTEQARRINYYMDEVRQKKRDAMGEPAADFRRGGGGESMQRQSSREAQHYASSFSIADQQFVAFGSNSRSFSWPKIPSSGGDGRWGAPPPPMPYLPPPPPPPPPYFPKRGDRYDEDRNYGMESRKRNYDGDYRRNDRGGDYGEASRRSFGNERDHYYRRERSPERHDQSRGRHSRDSSRK